MKRIFTFSLFLFVTVWTVAQGSDTLRFVDKDGHILDDGTIIQVKDLVEDVFLGNYISSGISVKNISKRTVFIRLSYDIEIIENGMFQICFPENCVTLRKTGSYSTTNASLDAGIQRNLQCEWFPDNYGFCKVHLTIEVLNDLLCKIADGPSVTVVFSHTNPAHVDSSMQDVYIIDCYNLQGQHNINSQTGVKISRLSNGRIIKHISKQ